MNDGTAYAKRVREEFARLRKLHDHPQVGPADDPVRRLAVAVLGEAAGEAAAQKAVDRLLEQMAGWNELRVSTPEEIEAILGDSIPDVRERARRLTDALNAIFYREHKVSLDRLKDLGRREARQYLEKLDGVDEYVVASVQLWSLGGHAIPVSDGLLESLRRHDLVHPKATRAEVQSFLERHVSAAEAREFCILINHLKGGRRPAGGKPASEAAEKKARTSSRPKRPAGKSPRKATRK